jgi:hypothetical protein
VPEVIDEGITGFVVANEGGARSNPASSRSRPTDGPRHATFERRFVARRMANDYLRIYEKVLEKRAGLDGVDHLQDVIGAHQELRASADSFAQD